MCSDVGGLDLRGACTSTRYTIRNLGGQSVLTSRFDPTVADTALLAILEQQEHHGVRPGNTQHPRHTQRLEPRPLTSLHVLCAVLCVSSPRRSTCTRWATSCTHPRACRMLPSTARTCRETSRPPGYWSGASPSPSGDSSGRSCSGKTHAHTHRGCRRGDALMCCGCGVQYVGVDGAADPAAVPVALHVHRFIHQAARTSRTLATGTRHGITHRYIYKQASLHRRR